MGACCFGPTRRVRYRDEDGLYRRDSHGARLKRKTQRVKASDRVQSRQRKERLHQEMDETGPTYDSLRSPESKTELEDTENTMALGAFDMAVSMGLLKERDRESFMKRLIHVETQEWTVRNLRRVENQPIVLEQLPRTNWNLPRDGKPTDLEQVQYWSNQFQDAPLPIILRFEGRLVLLDGVHRMVASLEKTGTARVRIVHWPRNDMDYASMISKQDVEPLLSTLGNGVEVKESSEPGIGLGVFASRRFEKDEPITGYTGYLVSYADAKKRNPSHLRSSMSMKWIIDGQYDEQNRLITDVPKQRQDMGVAAFANDVPSRINARYDYADDKRIQDPFDLDPRKGHRIVFLRSTQPIDKGQEIMVPYGSTYWGRGQQQHK